MFCPSSSLQEHSSYWKANQPQRPLPTMQFPLLTKKGKCQAAVSSHRRQFVRMLDKGDGMEMMPLAHAAAQKWPRNFISRPHEVVEAPPLLPSTVYSRARLVKSLAWGYYYTGKSFWPWHHYGLPSVQRDVCELCLRGAGRPTTQRQTHPVTPVSMPSHSRKHSVLEGNDPF